MDKIFSARVDESVIRKIGALAKSICGLNGSHL